MNKSKEVKNQKNTVQKSSTTFSDLRIVKYFPLFIILLISFLVYLPILNNGFVNWDETKYVQNNELIRTINFSAIFSGFQMGNYHPLTMLVYAIEFHFWQLNETGYHIINLLLHLLNVVLVYYVVQLIRGKYEVALLAALLFGIHPMHVESVAWAAELKDVLYSFFFLSSLIAYLIYKKSSSKRHYYFSLFLFLLSLLSKAMAVPLPLIFLLIDYYMYRKINLKLVLEKLPFILLALVFGIIAIYAQASGEAIQGFVEFSFFQHFIFACYGFINYIIKLLFPFNLSAFYPYPSDNNSTIPLHFYLYLPLLIAFIALVLYSTRFTRTILFGFGFFSITIFLVLQLLPVGDAIIADRYTYISSLGIIYLLAEGLYFIWSSKNKMIAVSLLFAFSIFYSIQTFSRCRIWKNGITLWTDVIEKYPGTYVAYGNRGGTLSNEFKYPEALADFNKAVELAPNYYLAYLNRGILFNNQKKYKEAFDDFDKAIKLNPNVAEIYNYRGIIYLNEKNYEKALSDFTSTIKLNPDFAIAFYNRGFTYMNQNKFNEALSDFNMSIKLDPNSRPPYNNRAFILQSQKKLNEALNDYDKAIELEPGFSQTYYNRGLILINLRKFEEAKNDFSKFIESDSSNAMAFYSRGIAEYYLNLKDNACNDIHHASEMGLEPARVLYDKFCK